MARGEQAGGSAERTCRFCFGAIAHGLGGRLRFRWEG